MKTPFLSLVVAIGLTIALTSCPETTVPKDFGVSPLKLKTAEWEGLWSEAKGKPSDDGLRFTVKDAAKGVITAQGTGKDDKPLEVYVRSAGSPEDKLCFLIYTEKSDDPRGPVHLISVPKDGIFNLWGINHGEVEKAVQSGELKGRLVKGDKEDHKHTEIDKDPSNYAKLMEPRFWNWTEPGTFVRVAQKK